MHLCSRLSSLRVVGFFVCGMQGPLVVVCERMVPEYLLMVHSRTNVCDIKIRRPRRSGVYFTFQSGT